MRSLVVALLLAGAAAGGDLDARLRYLVPGKDALAFRSIPWQPSLWDAVVAAHEEEKPILLWAMNGHPLALT